MNQSVTHVSDLMCYRCAFLYRNVSRYAGQIAYYGNPIGLKATIFILLFCRNMSYSFFVLQSYFFNSVSPSVRWQKMALLVF